MRCLPSLCLLLVAGCVGEPPVPCTKCGDVCVDLQTASDNCGTCGKICLAGTQCTAGVCKDTCPAGETRCGAQCVDTQTDARHCGACGMPCAMGEGCASGVCTPTCAAPLTTCGARCVNTQTDPANCGACGGACDAGVCSAGVCRLTCAAPLFECPGAVCADVRTDVQNCGFCGMTCAPAHVTAPRCETGQCGYAACAPGFVDCDGNAQNGCETTITGCMQLVSIAADGGAANGQSYGAVVDRAGLKVVFISEATNLVADDTNTYADVFVRDLALRKTTRLSVFVDGGELRADAGQPPIFFNSFGNQVAISADGKTVAVLTNAPLVPGDSNGGNDVVVFEADGGRSFGMLSGGGAQPGGNLEACCLTLSDDGKYVTWGTRASASFIGPGTNEFNIFIYDRQSRQIFLASPNASQGYVVSGPVGFNAFTSWVSSNGHYVLYNSFGDNIVGPADGCSHSYLRDVPIAVNYRMSSDNGQAPLTCVPGSGSAGGSSITPDGLTAAMSTNRMPPGRGLIYVRDMVTKRWTLLSTALDGGATDNDSNGGTNISDDGQVVVFGSAASNLTADDTNGAGVDCFAFDRSTGGRLRINGPALVSTRPDGGAAQTGCTGYRINSIGTHVVFDTYDALDPKDGVDTRDVYLRRVR